MENKKEMSNFNIGVYIFIIFLSCINLSFGIIIFMFPNEYYPTSFMYILGTISILCAFITWILLYFNYKVEYK